MLPTYTYIKGAVVVGLIAALTPALAVLWAQPFQQQQQQTLTPLGGTDAPPTAPAQGGLMWFTSQADFETFMAQEGKILKGIENYEESILPPAQGDGFDDTLKFGVPNLPDGFPFPNGLTGLPNLRVQSNLGGGNPPDENPRGTDGLFALSDGAFGAVSDVVVANFQSDSLDLIFTDGKSGVGFNTIATFGGASVDVRVYNTTNVFLGTMTTPADANGTNFIGVWSEDPIGRINIFDSGSGVEGGDNIQAWQSDALPTGACCFSDDPCSMETEADCVSSGGTYQGDDTDCKTNPCPGSCPWDFDGDGNVGATDLLDLLINWGPCQ